MGKNARLLAALACILCSVSCGSSETAEDLGSSSAERTDAPVVMVVDDPLAGRASLTEIARASDLVLVARASAVETGVELGQDLPPYSLITLEPEKIIRGEATKTIKILMQTQTESGQPLVVDGQPAFTQESSVWMLKKVDPSFQRPDGEYVLTSTSGIVPGENGSVDFHQPELTPSQSQAQKLGTIAKVAELVAR